MSHINLEEMRNNPYIKETITEDGLHAFNFTRQAFFDQHWDEQTTKARGLFTNHHGKVIGRGFEKFFDYFPGENLTYPVTIWPKLNGFLALAFKHRNKILIYTKGGSTNMAEVAQSWFTDPMHKAMEGVLERWYGATLAFEIIDPQDPHIVNYDESEYGAHLLAIIKPDGSTIPPTFISNDQALRPIRPAAEVRNPEELDQFINANNHTPNIEGWVIEDANGHFSKLKGDYYRTIKATRSLINRINNGKPVRGLDNPDHWREILMPYKQTTHMGNGFNLPQFAEDHPDKIQTLYGLVNYPDHKGQGLDVS